MKRRDFIVTGAAALATKAERSFAQQPVEKMPRVGILTPAFKQGLRELGYIEGRNIVLEFRTSHGDDSLLPQLATELVALPVDVIVTNGGAAALAAGKATTRIPIVMGAGPDPVSVGLAASLSHPGGNFTGFTLMAFELNAKRLDLLRTAFPNATAVAVLVNPSNAVMAVYLRETDEAARSMGLRIVACIEPGSPEALRALTPTVFAEAGAVRVLSDPMFWNHRQAIIALVNAARLPAMYPERDMPTTAA